MNYLFNKLIVFDLDETLLHASEQALAIEEQLRIGPYFIYERPHARDLIDFCFHNFQHIGVWTASSSDYAAEVCRFLFAEKFDRLAFLWSRDKCTRKFDPEYYSIIWVKDLKKLKRKGFLLEQIIMIDDTPAKLYRQYGNLIRVRPFEGVLPDEELWLLSKYLPTIADAENIRLIEKRAWRSQARAIINNTITK